jgi:N-acetylmuramoyl-L-alanine amidase
MTYISDDKVEWIVIHYSATPVEKSFSALDIDRIHRARGFKEIGYHLYGRRDGSVEAGRDLSNPGHFEQGAHSKGENSKSVGYCFEGGVTSAEPNVGFDSRTPEQIESMIREIKVLLLRFPNAKVVGHRDMPGASTQCPGFDVAAWWDSVKNVKPTDRSTKAKSKTLQASLGSAVAVTSAAGTAIGYLDGTAQIVIIGFLGVALLGLLWIARERIRKWTNGDR